MPKIKEFGVKQGGRLSGSPKENKKLVDEAINRVKETKRVTEDDYLLIANAERESEVQAEMVKAKEENSLGVPNSFYDLTLPEQSMLMYYLSNDFYHPLIQKRTHMDMLMSYITAYVSDEEIMKVYKPRSVLNDKGVVVDVVYDKVRNYTKYNEWKVEALKSFNSSPQIKKAWNHLVEITFGIEPKELLKAVILQDALTADTAGDRNANRKMMIDMLGIGKEHEAQGQQFNVFLQGGGRELASTIKDVTGDEYIVTEDDLSVDD